MYPSRSLSLAVIAVATCACASVAIGSPAHAQRRRAPTPQEAAAQSADLPSVPPPPTPTDFNAELRSLMVPGGLTSDQAVIAAVETAPSVDRAQAAVLVAEAGARQAWYRALPIVQGNGSYSRLSHFVNQNLAGGLNSPQVLQLINQLNDPTAQQLWTGLVDTFSKFQFPILRNRWLFQAEVGYPVSDVFTSVLPAYRAATSFVEASEAQTWVQKYQVAWSARQTYYEFVRATASLIVAQSSVEQMEASRAQVQALVNGGAAARVDLMRVDAILAQTQVGLAQAENGVAVARQALATLMHAPLDSQFQVGEDFSQALPPVEGDVGSLIETAAAQRPELIALRRLEEARVRNIRVAQSGAFPHLNFLAQFRTANPNPFSIPQTNQFRSNWMVTALLSWSLNDTLDASAQAQARRAELQQVRDDIYAMRDGLRMEVSRAYHALEAAKVALEAARVGLTAADESYRVRFEQLQAGAAVTRDLIDAEADLTTARLQLIDAAVGLRLAYAGLLYAIGHDSEQVAAIQVRQGHE